MTKLFIYFKFMILFRQEENVFSCVTFHQWSEFQAWNREKTFPKLECQWVKRQ